MVYSRVLGNIQKLSRDFVDKYCKDESVFFNSIWEIYEPELKKLIDKPPRKWHIKISKAKLMGALGFSDPTERPDITAPVIIGVLAATFWHIGTLSSEPTKEAIEKMIVDYSGKFGASQDVKNKLIEFLPRANLASFIRREIIGVAEEKSQEKEYDVYINGEYILKNRNEVQELESQKNEYLVWVWVDDEKSEIIVDKEYQEIKPDSIAFKFLSEILKSVGKDLLHKTIYNEVTEIKKGNLHQNLNKLKEKTGHVLDDYISGKKRFRFSISKFKSCLIMKRGYDPDK